jgi:hypothetical protein
MEDEEVVVEETTEEETVTLSKAEYEKLNQTLGSLKKEVKTYKKEVEAPQKESNYENELAVTRLEVRGITNKEDIASIIEEANRLKLNAVEVAEMPHMKARLEAAQNQRTAENGSPSGSGRKGGAGKGDVDYYLAHDDERPSDLKLHNEVIDAKIKRETEGNMFSQVPFIG